MKRDIDAIRKELVEKVEGKVMVRKERGMAKKFAVYFEYPTTSNKRIIQEVLHDHTCVKRVGNPIVVGGVYGYAVIFDVHGE